MRLQMDGGILSIGSSSSNSQASQAEQALAALAALGGGRGAIAGRNPSFTKSVHSPVENEEKRLAGARSQEAINEGIRKAILMVLITGSVFIVLLGWIDTFRTFLDSAFYRDSTDPERYDRAFSQLSYTTILTLMTIVFVYIVHLFL